MADLTITAANVQAGENATTERGTAGATITAGQLVYKDSAGKYQLADTNGAAAARNPRGVALHAAAANQPLTILRAGDITIGATLTPGTDYWASDTPGGICPRADVASGEDAILVGVAKSTTVLAVAIQDPGVTL
jgi:hypothetical protein